MRNPAHVSHGVASLVVDGVELAGTAVPVAAEGSTVRVSVTLG